MDFDISFQLADQRAVVQVLDFDPMEYESYGDQMQLTLIDLQNVAYSEVVLETDDNQWHQMASDDIQTIPSYGSFVRNLNSCETDDFQNLTNSTTIENFKRINMCEPDKNTKCRSDCNCEACLQIYFNAETSDFDCFNVGHATVPSDFEDLFYLGNVTNANMVYDFTRLWNEAELTEYMEFPLHEMYTSTSENGMILFGTSILDEEGNVTAGAAGFYDTSAANTLMDL